MSSPQFEPLTIADKANYEHYYEQAGTRISDVHFVSRMAWNAGFNYMRTEIEQTLLLLSPESVFSTLHFSMPLGLQSADQAERIIDCLWDDYAGRFGEAAGGEPHLRFLYLEKDDLKKFKFLKKYKTEFLMKPAYSDYVYRADDLRYLKGKFYNGKRNHINKFLRAYPDYQFRLLTADDAERCLELVKEWAADREVDHDNLLDSDYRPIKTLFEHFDELGMSGGVVEVGRELTAFSMLSRGCEDTSIVHIEKADTRYRGAYAAINKFSAEHVFPDVKWINREEDMGIEGLHLAKQSYGPAYMVDKYEVRVTLR